TQAAHAACRNSKPPCPLNRAWGLRSLPPLTLLAGFLLLGVISGNGRAEQARLEQFTQDAIHLGGRKRSDFFVLLGRPGEAAIKVQVAQPHAGKRAVVGAP